MSEKPEPTAHVIFAGVREAEHELGFTEWHIECRWSDGDKGASIVVDGEREELADEIAAWLNRRSRDRILQRVGFDLTQATDYERAVLDRIGFDPAKLSAHERLEIVAAGKRCGMISPDRMKPFLDDLALLSQKHGIGLIPSHSRGFVAIELASEPNFRGYFGDHIKGSWLIEMVHRLTSRAAYSAKAKSDDPAEATAHQRIALARSLAEVREIAG